MAKKTKAKLEEIELDEEALPNDPLSEDTDTEETELEGLVRERDDYLARWQRAAADYKNLQRRSRDDVEAAVRRTMMPLLENLLLVLDHLDLALTTKVESDDASALAEGVRLTRDQFLQGLQQEGVEPIPDGGAFDPAVHEAVAAVEVEDAEEGSVVATVRRGFTWRGLVLRHAHVKVARGPSAGTESSDADGADED
jgi:molecular chaperone GrpE